MKIIGLFVIGILILHSCKEGDKGNNDQTAVKTDSLLVTENSWGVIKQDMDFEVLRGLYGNNEVKDSTIYGPEGMDTIPVSFLLPGKPGELIIYWKDSQYHRQIHFIESYHPEAPYHTASGLKIGSDLKQLLDVNGKQINFMGFGWDYGGTIMSYNGGKLDSTNISFTLTGSEEMPDGLSGDTELNTAEPLVQKFLDKIRISQMMLRFNEH